MGRGEEDDNGTKEVGLYDAKDSGSIENSAQLMLGAWRPERDELVLRVLKQTKGRARWDVHCNYDGDRQTITERAWPNEAYEQGDLQ